MRSPKDMSIIQIDITNACPHLCSNCTRFCGNHTKPFFMDFDTFKKAVDSLIGAPPVIGIIGGEPTIHPEFDKFMRYFREKIPEKKFYPLSVPVKNPKYLYRNIRYMRAKNRGIFTSLGPGYRKHYELIQDTFPFQSINDHYEVNNHQAIMVTRKELGFSDEEWFKLRDNCWLQNLWSASITPKGAFFCEIAANLDLIFNGPGGWPVEPGWWKRKPADFADQLHWCELCAMALPMPTLPATEQRDIISPVMLEKLKAVHSPRVEKGRYILLDPKTYRKEDYGHDRNPTWYVRHESARVSPLNDSLKVGSVTLNPTPEQWQDPKLSGWFVIAEDPAEATPEFLRELESAILNPGFLYSYRKRIFVLNRNAEFLRGKNAIPEDFAASWPKCKRYELRHFPFVATPDWKDKIRLFILEYWNRLAPLRPW